MKTSRRKFTASFKAKVALEAIKEQLTVLEISSKYKVHPSQISTWKQDFLNKSSLVFDRDFPDQKSFEEKQEKLYSKIGELQVQVDFLKKALEK